MTSSGKKRYEGVMLLLVLRGGFQGVEFSGKKHYIILEWPHVCQ